MPADAFAHAATRSAGDVNPLDVPDAAQLHRRPTFGSRAPRPPGAGGGASAGGGGARLSLKDYKKRMEEAE